MFYNIGNFGLYLGHVHKQIFSTQRTLLLVLKVLFGRQQDFSGRHGNTGGPMNPRVLPDRVIG